MLKVACRALRVESSRIESQVDLSLDNVLDVLKLLTGIGGVGEGRCPDAGLACVPQPAWDQRNKILLA